MVKRILVALSGTDYTEAAVEHAVELARQHGAELAGVTDMDMARIENVGPVPIGAGAAAAELAQHRERVTSGRVEQAVTHFETVCRKEKINASVYREVGEPYEHLASLWRYHDLTIAGLQGLFEYDILHEPDDILIRLISGGVRPILAVAPEYRPVERALLAYNGSMESAKAMKRFVQMHLWPGISLHIACFEIDKPDALKLLDDAAAYCRAHGFEPKTEWVEAPAKEALLEHGRDTKADIIVMGSTARARIFRRMLGDTVLHAIKHAEVPLFLTQ